MILLIGLFYLVGILVLVYFIAQDTQIELIKEGYFYTFSTIYLRILSKPRKILFTSWLGLIWYLTKY